MIPFNSKCFGQTVRVKESRETGKVVAFCSNMRMKQKQFLVEYVAGDGRFIDAWFFEDQIEVV